MTSTMKTPAGAAASTVSTSSSSSSSSSSQEFKDHVVLTSAPPPWHSLVLMTVVMLILLYTFPTPAQLDQDATATTLTRRLFPELLSLRTLALVRGFLACVIWGTTIQMSCLSKGWMQQTKYLPQTKLRSVPNHLVGWKTLCPFTSVSWNLLGLHFTLSSYIAYQQALAEESAAGAGAGAAVANLSPWLLRASLLVWETVAPCTCLVSVVIRYVIWPGVLRSPNPDTTNLKSFRNVLMHNMNVIMSLTEALLLGGLPVRWSHAACAPLLGVCYVFFTWSTSHVWNEPQHGPQFLYFFLDTTLPGYFHSIALTALLVVLLWFYALFASLPWLLAAYYYILPGAILTAFASSIIGHAVVVLGVASLMMRFRD